MATSNYLNDKQLDDVLSQLIDKMKDAGFLDKNIDTKEILEKLRPVIEAAKDKGMQITPDLIKDPKNLKKIMTIIISATLEIQFKDHPTLKNKFNTAALATFLFDLNQPENLKEHVLNLTLKMAALSSHLAPPRPTPSAQKNQQNEDQNKDQNKIAQNNAPQPEDELQKLLDFLYEQMWGQTRTGIMIANSVQITNSAGIVKTVGDIGAGNGGVLEEIEKLINQLGNNVDDAFKQLPKDLNNTAEEIAHDPHSILSVINTPRYIQT